MPTYFYHLKFELYPSPTPDSNLFSPVRHCDNIWLPAQQANIFADLPSHSRPDRRTSHTVQSALQFEHPVKSTSRSATQASLEIIDCGASAQAVPCTSEPKSERLSERQWLEHSHSFSPPSTSIALRPRTAIKDWRFGRVSIESIDLSSMSNEASKNTAMAAPALGPILGGAGTMHKAECLPLKTKNTEAGWGIVHFYREGEEIPRLSDDQNGEQEADESTDYSTLCIPAVPVYMSPGDFIGFVGERWRKDISHCRMVMTSKMNRYLVLLKFRNNESAKCWRKEFDGKVFNTIEPTICHVVFVRISFNTPSQRQVDLSVVAGSLSTVSGTLKPFPPPTPNLMELPTCPVCLERMDDTNGLMTIPCSHVFHCTCLQNWKGTGCPVCRFTNTFDGDRSDPSNPYTQPFGSSISNMCTICDCTDDLWICLICGHVGCGRYKGGHAKDHWKETAHSFSLELETQHVWDYAGDMWVHRLIRDKGDGKVVELPGRQDSNINHSEHDDVVPRAKLESIGMEYTHLITSQLESQRAYYEEMINKTVDKASKASAVAEHAMRQAAQAMEKLSVLDEKYSALTRDAIPQLERDLARESAKASKSYELARDLSQSVQEEKQLNQGLLKRIEHVNNENKVTKEVLEKFREESKRQKEEIKKQKEEIAELQDLNHDLNAFISGQAQLQEMENAGKLEEGDIEGATMSVPGKRGKRRGKK